MGKLRALWVSLGDRWSEFISELKARLNLVCRYCAENECTNIRGGLCEYCRCAEQEWCKTCTQNARYESVESDSTIYDDEIYEDYDLYEESETSEDW